MPVILDYMILNPYGVGYQETALPMHDISPFEAALHPLGIMPYSSCDLAAFLEGILKSERIMEYRIGVVDTIEYYYGLEKRPSANLVREFLPFHSVNGRGIENWIQLEMNGPISWVCPYITFDCVRY